MLGPVPIEIILHWPSPNYLNPETRGWAVVIICVVFGGLALLTSIARFWARLVVMKKWHLDDYVLVPALLATMGMLLCECLGTQVYHIDRHIWDTSIDKATSIQKIAWAVQFLYVQATGLVRISITLFYLRLTTRQVSPKFVYACWFSVGFSICYMVTFSFTSIFTCVPFKAIWASWFPWWAEVHEYRCINGNRAAIAASIISSVQDLVTCLLPTSLLYGMRIPLRQKIMTGLLFGLGILVCAVAAARVAAQFILEPSWDETWLGFTLFCFIGVEVPLIIVCANAPTLKVFIKCFKRDEKGPIHRPSTAIAVRHCSQRSNWSGQTLTGAPDMRLSVRTDSSAAGEMEHKDMGIVPPLAVYGRETARRIHNLESALKDDGDSEWE